MSRKQRAEGGGEGGMRGLNNLEATGGGTAARVVRDRSVYLVGWLPSRSETLSANPAH